MIEIYSLLEQSLSGQNETITASIRQMWVSKSSNQTLMTRRNSQMASHIFQM